MRLFFAVEMPPEVQAPLAELIDSLRSAEPGVRWVKAAGLHLTLRFLGELHEERLEAIVAAVRFGTAGCPPLFLRTAEFGTIPQRGRPRVVWMGLLDESGSLEGLHTALNGTLEQSGFSRETRPFRPHVTLGRVRQGARPGRLLEQTVPPRPIPFVVREFVLMQSELGPQGACYTPRARFPLLEAA
ncbi:MAG: RNA 2',3'-cyclic phosphodiesterase [Acidobacteriota bacterium]